MAKQRPAKKSLGFNPFETPKSAAPMKLMSLDPQAKPPAAVKTPQPKPSARPARAIRKTPAVTKVGAASKISQADEASPAITRPLASPRPETSAFAGLAQDYADRLKQPAAKPLLDDEKVRRVDELIARLEGADLPELERGLFDRFKKAWQFFALFGRSMNVDDFGLDPRFEEMVSPLLDFMYRRWWRVEVTGMENVPAEGRALLVSNHSGMLPYDGGMIKHAIRTDHPSHREVRPLVEDFVYHFPFLGALMARMGGVRACQENAQRLLEKDELVVVFPEGVKGIAKLYRYRYQLQRFGRGGFVKLCLRTGAPIIPTAVIGAEEIHPIVARADFLARPLKVPVVPITPTLPLLGPLGLIPLPTKWFIHFGRPIDLRAYGKAALDDELLINKITADVRTQIQELIYEQLKKRRSVFFG
jgi:1-acyl-sn-glycerol-3-phosphate acyltransferase